MIFEADSRWTLYNLAIELVHPSVGTAHPGDGKVYVIAL